MVLRKCGPVILLPLALFFAACVRIPAVEGLTPAHTITLLPYSTPTMSLVDALDSDLISAPTVTPQPETYTVVAGDSLLAIAYRYGIDVADLINANPQVDPNAMSVGTELIIPEVKAGAATSPGLSGLPTPVIGYTRSPDCFLASASEWLCFLLVENDQENWVKSLTGTVKVISNGKTYSAYSPLDALAPGESMPLIAYIGQTYLDPEEVTGTLDSALLVSNGQYHYQSAEILHPQIEFGENYQSARVLFSVSLPMSGNLRLIAYATDDNRHILGYRLWDSQGDSRNGQIIDLDLTLYSLGGVISDIHFASCVSSQ